MFLDIILLIYRMVMYGLVKCRRVRVLKTRVFQAMLPFLVEFHQKIEAVVKHCLTPLELHYVALSLVGPQPTPTNLPNPSELHHLLETVWNGQS